MWECTNATLVAACKHGNPSPPFKEQKKKHRSPSPQLEVPQGVVGVHLPNSIGRNETWSTTLQLYHSKSRELTEAWDFISSTQGGTFNRGIGTSSAESASPQPEKARCIVGVNHPYVRGQAKA